MKNSYDNVDLVANVIFVVILIIVAFVVSCIEHIGDESKYNNGICKSCGGHYEYQEAVGHRFDTDYIYRCDKCGKIIEISYVAGGDIE